MARKSTKQLEVPGTESPERIPELHALGVEIKDLENDRKEATALEKEKRQEAAAALKAHGLEEYDVDGIHIWIEHGKDKLKVKLGGEDKDRDPEEID